jgi:hypothetical protein
MKIRPMVAGTTTITAPATRLYRKFAKDGVMDFHPLFGYSIKFFTNNIIGLLISWKDYSAAYFPATSGF